VRKRGQGARLPVAGVICLVAVILGAWLTGGFGDTESAGSAPSTATAPSTQEALAQLDQTRASLRAALATYRGGDAAKADEQVGDAYLAHFEIVEKALDPRDKPLRLRIEKSIREDLRARIKARAPLAELRRMVDRIEASFVQAQAALR